jgi:predicted GNAT family N-acyltransferase
MRVRLFEASDAASLSAALALRFRVFVDEQGVPAEEEEDAADRAPGTVHALVEADGEPVATGRFYEADPGVAQIGRMAVAAGHRGRGLGTAVLEALIGAAGRRSLVRARLLAQVHAEPFYARFGFVVAGDVVMDGGIPHRSMVLILRP